MTEVTTAQPTRDDRPADQIDTPGGTVTGFVYQDGGVLVVSDSDFTSGDWQHMCARLTELRTAEPLTGPAWEGECDVWQTRLTPAC
jgi:hypothetical protein